MGDELPCNPTTIASEHVDHWRGRDNELWRAYAAGFFTALICVAIACVAIAGVQR